MLYFKTVFFPLCWIILFIFKTTTGCPLKHNPVLKAMKVQSSEWLEIYSTDANLFFMHSKKLRNLRNLLKTKKLKICHLGFQITIYIHLQILHLFCIQNIYFQFHYKTIVVLMLSSKKKNESFQQVKCFYSCRDLTDATIFKRSVAHVSSFPSLQKVQRSRSLSISPQK